MAGEESSIPGDTTVRPTLPSGTNGAGSGTSQYSNGAARPRMPQPPPVYFGQADRSSGLSTRTAWGRSDSVALASMLMLLITLVGRVQYPELAKDLAIELRYLVGLLASCFMLGVSGWFQAGSRFGPKIDAAVTLSVLIALVALWDFLLSGTLPDNVTRMLDNVLGWRLR